MSIVMKRNNRVVNFEIPTDYPEKSMEFFKTIFGGNFSNMVMKTIGW